MSIVHRAARHSIVAAVAAATHVFPAASKEVDDHPGGQSKVSPSLMPVRAR
jgi:hypothetical protein